MSARYQRACDAVHAAVRALRPEAGILLVPLTKAARYRHPVTQQFRPWCFEVQLAVNMAAPDSDLSASPASSAPSLCAPRASEAEEPWHSPSWADAAGISRATRLGMTLADTPKI